MARFAMPKLSDTMEEGTILQWLVGDGEAVEKGQPVVEIETDKANMTVEAPEAGTLRVLAQEGDVLPVGDPIAEIGDGAGPAAAPEVEDEAGADREEAGAEEGDGEGGGIPTSDDGTGGEIGAELGPEESYPGARAADEA
ncbi:MAG: 2-oxo acid dehydrogenase subunit E2, partial [Thermoleophilia bacterium]|nr:2-oxo acid dehydrogenase subunit E2 [Thermoleophilia bacterium]